MRGRSDGIDVPATLDIGTKGTMSWIAGLVSPMA
jgi:hypothetical protein